MNIAGPVGLLVLIIVLLLIAFGLSKFIKVPVRIIFIGLGAILIFSLLMFIASGA